MVYSHGTLSAHPHGLAGADSTGSVCLGVSFAPVGSFRFALRCGALRCVERTSAARHGGPVQNKITELEQQNNMLGNNIRKSQLATQKQAKPFKSLSRFAFATRRADRSTAVPRPRPFGRMEGCTKPVKPHE